MDQAKIDKNIKENRGILRQLTALNNEVRGLKGRVRKLEKAKKELKYSIIKGHSVKIFDSILDLPIEKMSDEEIANIKVGGTD